MKLLLILLLAFIKAPESNGYPEWAQGPHSYSSLYCYKVPDFPLLYEQDITEAIHIQLKQSSITKEEFLEFLQSLEGFTLGCIICDSDDSSYYKKNGYQFNEDFFCIHGNSLNEDFICENHCIQE